MKRSPGRIVSTLFLLPLTGCLCLPGGESAAGQPGWAARAGTPTAHPGTSIVRPDTLEAQAGAASMRVLWTVSGYLVGKDATWSEQEASSFLFKPLDMTPSEIIFDGRSCTGVHFQRQTVAAADYLPHAWQVTPGELGIEEREIEVVQTDCALPGFQKFLRLQGNRLVIRVEGVVYFFDPVWNR